MAREKKKPDRSDKFWPDNAKGVYINGKPVWDEKDEEDFARQAPGAGEDEGEE